MGFVLSRKFLFYILFFFSCTQGTGNKDVWCCLVSSKTCLRHLLCLLILLNIHSRWHPPRVLSSDEQLKWRSFWPRPSARRETQKGVETERQTMVGVEPYFLATGHTAQQPTIHTAQQPPSPATGPPCAVSSLHLYACSKARPRSCFSETFPHPVSVEVAVV